MEGRRTWMRGMWVISWKEFIIPHSKDIDWELLILFMKLYSKRFNKKELPKTTIIVVLTASPSPLAKSESTNNKINIVLPALVLRGGSLFSI